MPRAVLSFEQKSRKWEKKEKDLLSAYRSGVAGGTADYVQLVLDKTRTKQMVNASPAMIAKSRALVLKKAREDRANGIKGVKYDYKGDLRKSLRNAGLKFNDSQAINRTHSMESALRAMRFSVSEMGIVTGRNQDGNVLFQLSPTSGKFVGFIDITGKVGTAMKVMINKFRIRILSAGASKANTMWKKMVFAGLQQNMQKRFGALNR